MIQFISVLILVCGFTAQYTTALDQEGTVWIETRSGVGFSLGKGTATDKNGVPTPFTDSTSCAVEVTNPDSTKASPDISTSGGNGGGCNLGTDMTFNDPTLGGNATIQYTVALCSIGNCKPKLTIGGQAYDMDSAENCEHGKGC